MLVTRLFEKSAEEGPEAAEQREHPDGAALLGEVLAALGGMPVNEGGTALVRADPAPHLLPQGASDGIAAEKFRLLSHRLHQLRQKRPVCSVLVTSSVPREGKTVVAANLAAVLARGGGRVLLIDGDLRRPGLPRMLALPDAPGLAEVLESRAELAGVLRLVEPFRFYYVPAGTFTDNPVGLFQRATLRGLLDKASTVFDWIVMDSAPLTPFADSYCLAALTDAVLVVARAGVTPRQTLRQAVAALDSARCAGLVLNAFDNPHQDSYYSGYTASAAGSRGRARG